MSIKLQLARLTKSGLQRAGWAVRRRTTCIGEMEPFLERLGELGFRPRHILDVGANKAEWARMAHRYFPDAGFLLIEPQSEMLSELRQFCAEVPGSRWELAAAGPQHGELVLNVWLNHLPGSSLLPLVDDHAPSEQRRVPILTIDSLYPEDSSLPDFVKLDVQGFELEALKGASRVFGHAQCIMMEVGLYATSPSRPLVAEVVAFMDARNYKLFDVPGFARRPFDRALGEIDLAFVLKGGELDRHQNWC